MQTGVPATNLPVGLEPAFLQVNIVTE